MSVVIFKPQRVNCAFAHAPTVRRVASFVNDHFTMCSLIQTCRWSAEFCDDDLWRFLAELPDHEKPPFPFPSFQSYFRTLVLSHEALPSTTTVVNGIVTVTPTAAVATAGPAGEVGNVIRPAFATKNLSLPYGVVREQGQMLRAKGVVLNPQIVRLGAHVKTAHVLLVDRPEHILVGYCNSKGCPSASQSVTGPHHQLFALPFMLRGYIVHVHLDDVAEGSGGSGEKTPRKKMLRVTRDEFDGSEVVMVNEEVKKGGDFDQLIICFAANNACCAVI